MDETRLVWLIDEAETFKTCVQLRWHLFIKGPFQLIGLAYLSRTVFPLTHVLVILSVKVKLASIWQSSCE